LEPYFRKHMPMSKVEGWKVRIFEIVLMTEGRFASGSFETEGLLDGVSFSCFAYVKVS
jgi:hypothetical protein